jgi:hypothetical protein
MQSAIYRKNETYRIDKIQLIQLILSKKLFSFLVVLTGMAD